MFDLEVDGGEDGFEGRHEAAFAEVFQDVAQGGFLAVLDVKSEVSRMRLR